MNSHPDTSAKERTRQILEDLEAVRENLLALSDDIWLSIDHNDQKALEEGCKFKGKYNDQMTAFGQRAAELSRLIQQYTAVRLEESEQTGAEDSDRNKRIVAELSRKEPHSLGEDFTYKRPHGFILDGQATAGITTWRRLYELVCQQLLRRNPGSFRALPDNPDFISRYGKPYFAREAAELRMAALIGDGVYAETNFSANSICDRLRDLLPAFNIPVERFQLFLRKNGDGGKVTAKPDTLPV